MKKIFKLSTFVLVFLTVFSCNKPEPEVAPTLSTSMDTYTFEAEGGTAKLNVSSNLAWTAKCAENWVSLSATSGGSNATVTVTVAASEGDDRSAEILVSNGKLNSSITINQKGTTIAGLKSATMAEFIASKPDNTTWYQLTGTILSIAGPDYGNFYIYDNTGTVYVYGLTTAKVDKNDKSFPTLGLKAGDKVTIAALRSEYKGQIEAGGTTPAYYIRHSAGTYEYGFKAAKTESGWLELPKTSDQDKYDFICHYGSDKKRSYSLYWDYENLVSHWVAYPLNKGLIGNGDRTDAWALDPLLDRDQQPYMEKAFTAGNNGMYDRGHQLPSADRFSKFENMQTFYGTNITPQSNDLNGTAWAGIEQSVRNWSKANGTDTLYVVTGCDLKDSKFYVYDNDNKKVTVPSGYFKAVLRYSKTDGYKGLALYIKNEKSKAGGLTRDLTMSIDALEEKLGFDFFFNLDDATEKVVEAADPSADDWWWEYK